VILIVLLVLRFHYSRLVNLGTYTKRKEQIALRIYRVQCSLYLLGALILYLAFGISDLIQLMNVSTTTVAISFVFMVLIIDIVGNAYAYRKIKTA
jgi:hypothetical protein